MIMLHRHERGRDEKSSLRIFITSWLIGNKTDLILIIITFYSIIFHHLLYVPGVNVVNEITPKIHSQHSIKKTKNDKTLPFLIF